ncbi:MAG: glycosyltransferase family 4 protein [Cyanobacteriota bacterium]
MRFLFVAPSAYLLGGVQDWLYSLSMELKRKGHAVKVAVPNNFFHNGAKYSEHYKGIDIVFFSNRTGSYQGRLNALCKLLINYPTDIVVGVNIGDLYEAYRRVMNKIQGTRIVMTLHAFEVEYLRDIAKYSRLLDGVITTNKLSKKMVTKLGLINESRVLYAPYGVDSNRLIVERKHRDTLKVAWVGRLENQQKRIKDLAYIVKHLESNHIDYQLSIAGEGPAKPEIQKELEVQIREKKIDLVGCLDKNKLHEFYNKHDILLITSEWETGPIVAWEAMLSGLAVVSSQYVGSRLEAALINEETALLFPIGAHQLAAKQITRLAETNLRERISKHGMLMAESRYSLDHSVSSWEEAFYRITRLKPRENIFHPRNHFMQDSGKLDSLLGAQSVERLREVLGKKGYCRDPGCEWPHSFSSKSTSKQLLDYAKILEKDEPA